MFCIVETSAGRNGVGHAVVRQCVQQLLGTRQHAKRRRLFGVCLGMHPLNPFRIPLGNRLTGFTQQGIEHQATAHPDLPVNAPDREFDAGRLCCLAPGQDVLIDTVDERAVKIEEKSQ